MKLMFLFFLVFISASSPANVIEAPILSVDFEQNPPDMTWKHLTTKHFDIIFPSELEEDAQRVGHLLEKAYPFVTRSLESAPNRIPLILQNQSVESNGFVTLAPRRSEFYVTPSVDPELGNTEWLKTLSIHEFRHIVQFQKGRQGFNKYFEMLLGQTGQALGLGLTLPPWFFEGDAVGIETALTRGGRGRLPQFDRDLRTLLLSGKDWNYDKAHLGSYDDYVPNHYVYGYFYTSWLRNHYGDLFLSKLANHSAQNSWNPLTFYNSTSILTNQSFDHFYRSVMKELVTEWKKRQDALTLTPFQVKNLGRRFGWTNYQYPQSTKDGKILALKRGLSFIDQYVLIDGKNEKTLFYPARLQNDYPYKLRNNRMAFFEADIDPRWGYRDFSRLKVYDIKKESFILDQRKTKGRLAVLNQTGEKIVYIEWASHQKQAIVGMSLEGQEIFRLPYPKTSVITSIDWLNDNELVFVAKDQDDLKSIQKINISSGTEEVLVKKEVTNLGFISVTNGTILFESPKSGIDNIWMVTKDGPIQLTSSPFGAYSPSLAGDKLLYNDYSVNGMNIVTKSINWKTEQKSENSFYPIFEKFSKSEDFSSLETELAKAQEFKVKDYSQTKHAINLHSWVILAPPLSSTVTLAGYSRDVLNKFSLAAGAEYNINERTTEGFVSSTWSHLYPVFDLRGGYGKRRQEFRLGNNQSENTWEEGTFEAGVQIPWNYLQGRFVHSFTSRAFSKLIKVNNKITDASEMSNGSLFSPGVEFSYNVASRFAKRDINPAWGFMFNGKAEEGKDISGNGMKGSHQAVEARIYLPGLWYHHSFYHQIAYERQRNRSYEYSSLIVYPRGTRNVFLQEFQKYSGNYLMPLFYPDYNLSRFIYFKRVSFNLFYDELSGRLAGLSYEAASAGWETIFEMNFLRIFIPFSIGVRGSYIINGLEKDDNYEVFLASQLGTF
jgi:hypothetical protein